MSARTVGWRFSMVFGSGILGSSIVLAAALGCSSQSSSSSTAEAKTPVQPESVVQHIEPAPSATRASAPPAGNASAPPSGGLTASNSTRPVGSITPKHLEAELNRLEAEIGN